MPVAIIQKSTAKIAFAGEIRDKKLIDAFTEASISGLTGILKLKVSRNEYYFYFVKGSLIYSSNMKKTMDQTVLEIIKYSGFISREKLLKCEKEKSKAMKTILEMLIDEGFVSMLLYSKVISLAMRINIINAMLENDGSYSFEIKAKIESVQGVKPVSVTQLKPISTLIEENRAAVKEVTDSLYSEIDKCAGAAYLKQNQSFIHNAITAESDYLKFFSTAVTDFIDKKWSFPSFFLKDKLLNSIAVYTFRTLIIIGICIFLYLALMTTTFDLKNEEISGKDFYFIREKITKSLQDFQTAEKKQSNPKAAEPKDNGVKSTKSKNIKK
ncbi:hypothetical protein J6W78_05400 [bacterium]|nr:hypothetical protein [bacterium]